MPVQRLLRYKLLLGVCYPTCVHVHTNRGIHIHAQTHTDTNTCAHRDTYTHAKSVRSLSHTHSHTRTHSLFGSSSSQDLLKNTPATHPDLSNLTEAMTKVITIAATVNEKIKEEENFQHMCVIQKSFVGNVKVRRSDMLSDCAYNFLYSNSTPFYSLFLT